MSYSFNFRAASKAEAKEKVVAEMAKVAEQQPCHAADKDHAIAAASSFIDLLPDDDTQDVAVSVNGYLTGSWQGSTIERISGAAFTVNASLGTRLPA